MLKPALKKRRRVSKIRREKQILDHLLGIDTVNLKAKSRKFYKLFLPIINIPKVQKSISCAGDISPSSSICWIACISYPSVRALPYYRYYLRIIVYRVVIYGTQVHATS